MPFGKTLQIFFGALEIEYSCCMCAGLDAPSVTVMNIEERAHVRHNLVLQPTHEHYGDFGDLWEHFLAIPVLMT